MGHRIFQIAVVLLWLVSMSWLIIAKVLPPLQRGSPPGYLAQLPRGDQFVGWKILYQVEEVGRAVTLAKRQDGDVTEVHNRVLLRNLSLGRMLPDLLAKMIPESLSSIDIDAKSQFDLDSLGRLSLLRSTVRVGSLEEAMKISGRMLDEHLELRVRIGGSTEANIVKIPATTLMADKFAPQAELHGLYLGRSWTVRVLNPFQATGDPTEILQAKVEDQMLLPWGGKLHPAWVVVYRKDSGASFASSARSRGRMWVGMDGKILKQEVKLLNASLYFVRLSPEESEQALSRLIPEEAEKRLQ